MLFLNTSHRVKRRTFHEGGAPTPTIILGDNLRHGGIMLSVPEMGRDHLVGFYSQLSIVTSVHGIFPGIGELCESDLYLILSSRPDATAMKDVDTKCHILAPNGQPLSVFNIAPSRRPGECSWHEVIIRAAPGDIYAIATYAAGKNQLEFSIVGRAGVIRCCDYDVIERYTRLLQDLRQQRYILRQDLFQSNWRDVVTDEVLHGIG